MLQRITINFDSQLRNAGLLFDKNIGEARNPFDAGLHLIGLSSYDIELVAIEFDSDLRFDARNHMADQVSQWLLGAGNHTRHLGHRLADFFDRCLSVGTVGDLQNDFADIHSFGMFIQFRSPGASNQCFHRFDFQQSSFDGSPDLSAGCQ